ncbi:MAG: hypothetical protein O3B24_11135, partial [Verrucomicrobia bacterium]|nr:hypothetical protein [Verrucomicrobiota bacterium]
MPAWVGRRDVPRIPGTLRPSAYVARAYLHQKEHGGQPPEWAQKRAGGQWLFLRDYLEEDGRQNLAAIGISEAARMLGASRRAVQTWVDDGRIPTLQEARA